MRWLTSRRADEHRIESEFALHIDLETDKLIREEGLAPEVARRRAIAAFGGVDQHKETVRDGRGLAWLGGFSLEVKLALRMLARYPGLTLVGGAAMAFGIAAGVGVFELQRQFVNPVLPLNEGSRIVGLRNWDASRNRAVPSTSSQFTLWRDELTRVEDVSAFRAFSRTLTTSDGRTEPERAAAMTASAFRVARVTPLVGRTLSDADEDEGAAPVVVIGHDVWARRFARDPGVVGQTVRLGGQPMTVVGVMPEGFGLPVAQNVWVPLRLDGGAASGGAEPALTVFGRLAPGVSRSQAQAEALVVGALDPLQTREQRRLQLVPYATLIFDPVDFQLGFALANTFMLMLLGLVSANVALLMFARAATRASELALRSALGAGRGRIVSQLFLEALALVSVAVTAGLLSARLVLGSYLALRVNDTGQPNPFWMGDTLTPMTLLYAAVLTISGAAIIGVLPALKITGRAGHDRLRQSTAGGGGVRFGGMWTAVIAAQVAATLMFPAAAFMFHRFVVEGQTRVLNLRTASYLSARLEVDRDVATTYQELERRLSAEPEVAGVTFGDRLPGTRHPRWYIEIDGEPVLDGIGSPVSQASVALNYFDVLGASVRAGRRFGGPDLDSAVPVVIVNESLVKDVLNGRNPVGRRIRRLFPGSGEPPGQWLDVVGVVSDLGMLESPAGLYRPTAPDLAPAIRMAIQVKGDPSSFAPRLRALANDVEPALELHDVMSLDQAGASQWLESQYLSRVLVVLSVLALLLSLTAIYSVMAFAVSRRTREIGIRVALGADRRRVIGVILRRPLTQVAIGIIAGGVLVTATFVGLFESAPTSMEAVLIAAYALLMMGVCLLACVVPARRALRVEPAEVLRADTS